MANEKNQALVFGGAALVGSALLLASKNKAAAAPGGTVALQESVMELLIAIAAASGDTLRTSEALLAAVQNLSINTKGYVPNADTAIMTRVAIAALDTPYRLPDIEVPDDMQLLMKAWPTNAGIIYVAREGPYARNVNQSYPLLPNENYGLRVKNANELWVAGITGAGSFAGDFLAVTVEQRRA